MDGFRPWPFPQPSTHHPPQFCYGGRVNPRPLSCFHRPLGRRDCHEKPLRRRQKAECRKARQSRPEPVTCAVRARYEPSASQVHGRYMRGSWEVHGRYKPGGSAENGTHRTGTTVSNCPREGHFSHAFGFRLELPVGKAVSTARLQRLTGRGRRSLRGRGRAGPAPSRPGPRCQ